MKRYISKIIDIYGVCGILSYSILTIIGLLLLNYIEVFSEIYLSKFTIEILVLFIILVLIKVWKLNILSMLRIEIINGIDAFMVYLIVTVVGVIGVTIVDRFNIIYIFILAILLIICMLIILYRSRIINTYSNKKKSRKSNVYDLKELYDGSIECAGNLILIEENDIEYDLLDRSEITTKLYETILNCNPKRKFVLSLEGRWGSGKTTILNIVSKKIKENNNIILINDFDPWSYNDEGSLFRGMFDVLLKKSGIKYSISKSNEFINRFYRELFDSEYGKKFILLGLFNKDDNFEINKIKTMINEYLEVNNKKIVFIIDNLDRASKENINLVFKLINNIFDFNYITYIISFDDTIMKRIIKDDLNLDYDYLKKIVQLQVKVPQIQSNIKEDVVEKCIKNLLLLYGEKEIDLVKYNNLIRVVNNSILDIRDLKRFLNSIINFGYKNYKHLNSIDIIAIEFIRIYNNKLYISILENREYYISNDKEYFNKAYEYIFNKKLFNKHAKEYFDNIFSDEENKMYKEVLSEIFPYVHKYKDGENLEDESGILYDQYEDNKNIVINNRICSAKYFDLYFTYKNNEFSYINKNIQEFINQLNKNNTINIIGNFNELINIHKNNQKILFETLEYYINDINETKLKEFIYVIFKNINELDNSLVFLGLNANERSIIIISKILLKLSDNDFNNYIDKLKDKYSNVAVIEKIIYWGKNNKRCEERIKNARIKNLENILMKMGQNIYDKNINIYEYDYSKGNINTLYNIFKINNNDMIKYIKDILNTDNVFKFLFDIISVKFGREYEYFIDEKYFNCFTTQEDINNILKERERYDEDEQFILEIYNDFINERNGVIYSNEIKINLRN